jgi:hypothetical protein
MSSNVENQTPVTPGQSAHAPALLRYPRPGNLSELDDDELQVLVSLAINTLRDRGITYRVNDSLKSKTPDIFDNARFEQITCMGLSTKYDGSPDELIPTLNSIHIRRQNKVWYSVTFLLQDSKQVDLVRNFSQITQEIIQKRASELWDNPDSLIMRHSRGTDIYNSRLLALFLMNSLTADFAALLHSRINPKYSSDGPTLLFTMCTHIHWNHLAFVESIKNKIRLATLSDYKNDVPKFLRFLQDNLRLIISTGVADRTHNDLIPHILLQLRSTTIPFFQQSVLKWQRDYMENTLILTPSSLVTLADEECQVLKHSCQWVETIDPSIAAMQAMLQSTKDGSTQFFQTLAANFNEITKRQKDITKEQRNLREDKYQSNNPDWLFMQPADLSEVRTYKGRQWSFCTKCGRNGRWVCTHNDSTNWVAHPREYNDFDNYRCPHRESYHDTHYRADDSRYCDTYASRDYNYRRDRDHRSRDSRSRSPVTSRSRTPPPRGDRSVSFRPPTPKSPSAQLSLLDSISMFLRTP